MGKLIWTALSVAGLACVVIAVFGCAPLGSGDAEDDSIDTCEPGASWCGDGVSRVCKADGSGWIESPCDPVQGMGCDIDTKVCVGECTHANLGDSYIGCEYFATVTGNHVHSEFSFAVAISNTSDTEARIQIDGGALAESLVFMVPAGSLDVRELPWVPLLKGCINEWVPNPFIGEQCGSAKVRGALEHGGAYHVRSDRPVTVYQFNPLDFKRAGNAHSYSNDASLLIPTNAMGNEYYVAAWPAWDNASFVEPGLMAVTATWDDTRVTVTTRAPTEADNFAPAFEPGVPRTVTLDRGDVLQLFAFEGDLTGSHVVADRPIQVIGGHYCTQVPIGVEACDHLEESMFPLDTLGNRYIVTAPALPVMPEGKQQIVRVVAVQDGTMVEVDPPLIPPSSLSAGELIELPLARDLEVNANHRILVSQFMIGQNAGGDSGDPAMALAVGEQQFRRDYQFHAPVNYEANYVNVIAPDGASVQLDGATVGGFVPVGSSGYRVARVALSDGRAGDHVMTGDEPFGVSVYGYGAYTSYWYPGGLDLAPIVVP